MVTTYHDKMFLVVAGGLALGALTACGEGTATGGNGGTGGSGASSTSTSTTTTTASTTSSSTTASSSSGIVFQQLWSFDSAVDGWAIVDASDINSTLTADMQAAAATTLKTNSTLEVDTAEGDPMPGSLKVTIPFTEQLQSLLIAITPATAVDLTGKTLVANIRIDQGIDMMHPTGGVLYTQSGMEYAWCDNTNGGSTWTNLTSTTAWATMKFSGKAFDPVSAGCYVAPDAGPSTYNIGDVRRIGIKIGTGTGEMIDTTKPTIVHIDQIGYY